MPKLLKRNIAAALLSAAVLCGAASQSQPILTYIKQTWGVLTRSNKDLATAAVDPKFHPAPMASGQSISPMQPISLR